ncbi:pre-mRNA processing factor 3-domain-containing protein [Gorgonomyces haynaldii]|nr:pre-mRNA processing factor 3-domain-containing protein [Gorgonomyces haynaldii]
MKRSGEDQDEQSKRQKTASRPPPTLGVRPSIPAVRPPTLGVRPPTGIRPPTGATALGARPPGMRPVGMRPVLHQGSSDVQRKIELAKEQRRKQLEQEELERKQKEEESIFKRDKTKEKGGLNIQFHPALMMDTQKALAEAKKAARMQQKGQKVEKTLLDVKLQDERKKINPYLNPMDRIRTETTPKPRNPKQLQFNEPGKYIELAEQLRKQEQVEQLKKQVQAQVKKTGLEKELELVSDLGLRTLEPPLIEWWDQKLVGETYEAFNIDAYNPLVEELVTNMVQHPVPIKPPTKDNLDPKPLLLTKKEQKKLRRQNRLEKQRDKQDRQRLGLLPPDEPRITKQNFMRILGQEAVLAPSMVEQKVQEQVKARQDKHLQQIEEEKLTEEERKEKKRRKLLEDTSQMVQVCVYRINELTHPQHRFKVNKNAQQFNLTGVGLICPEFSCVVVEGGPKGMRHYKHLLMDRIDWNPVKSAEKIPNECHLVWEGQVQKQTFYYFKLRNFDSEEACRTFLEDKGVVHYWNACKHFVSS